MTAILVIEDDPGVSSFLRWGLEDEGYAVTIAGDGVEGLRCVEAERPAVILLDYGLPVLDGAGVADGLRERGRDDIPIVLVTADDRVDEKAGRVGARAVLRKPLDLEELLRVVAGLV
jgi:CheY-like chemotaxis protein